MNFREYQEKVRGMPIYDDPILGLVGEVGEVTEHVKKERRKNDRHRPIDKEEFTLELGDVLWYLCRLSDQYGISFDDIATRNIQKLEKRHGVDESI